MFTEDPIQIIAFYKFIELTDLPERRIALLEAMKEYGVLGTILIASEGFNSTLCAPRENIEGFIRAISEILGSEIPYKSSFYFESPFKRRLVKIKNEIVTLRKNVDISFGDGTHVDFDEWNRLLSDPNTIVLDTRNDYEFKVGTFKNAVNPEIGRFSDLTEYVDANLADAKEKNIAIFCTGGIRCEKFAPYMKQLGYKNIYQLEGGILKYIEKVPKENSLWEGECYVFDHRTTVDHDLQKGHAPDLS